MVYSTQLASTAMLSLGWITLSASTVVINKYILSQTAFTYVFTLALSHMLMSTFFCRLTFAVVPSLTTNSGDESHLIGRLVVIGALFALSLVASNASLARLDVASVQMIKALNPVIIYFAGWIAGLEKPALATCTSIAVICGGVMFAVQSAARLQPVGVLFQVISIMCDSVRYVFLQSTLQLVDGINSLNLLYMVAPIAGAFLTVAGAFYEFDELEAQIDAVSENLPLIIASSVVAFALNLCSYAYINATSALTTSVSGIAKDVVLIAVSGAFFGPPITWRQLLGFSIAVGGTLTYTKYRNSNSISLAECAKTSPEEHPCVR